MVFISPQWFTFGYGGGGAAAPAPIATIPNSALFPLDFMLLDWALPVKQSKVQHGNCEGYECADCKDFYPMAELNMPEDTKDPIRFECYSCRKGLRTLFGKI